MDAMEAARIAHLKWLEAEAEAEAEDRALMRKLVQEYKQRSQAGMPTTTMPLSDHAQDTSQTPSDGE